jgi:hypothetical protein
MTCPREVAGYMERARRAIDVAEQIEHARAFVAAIEAVLGEG